VVLRSYFLSDVPQSRGNEVPTKSKGRWKQQPWAGYLVCILMGAGGAYYAFFSCWLIVVGGVTATLRLRQWAPLKRAAIQLSLICLSAIVVLSPSLVYRLRHGENRTPVDRAPYMAEIYGLKLCQLIFPVTEHRLGWLAHLKERYNRSIFPPVNEGDCASLGVFAGLAFLALLGRWAIPGSRKQGRLAQALFYLNFACFLLGTVGGLGYLICFVFPQIRCYNRISIFLAFFALAYLGLLFDEIRSRYAYTQRQRWAFRAALLVLLLPGIFDQATNKAVPQYEATKAAYAQDAEFMAQVAASVPAETMIFQLPYTAFVEHITVWRMFPYDSLRPYLHSSNLRWSYGAMSGRPCS